MGANFRPHPKYFPKFYILLTAAVVVPAAAATAAAPVVVPAAAAAAAEQDDDEDNDPQAAAAAPAVVIAAPHTSTSKDMKDLRGLFLAALISIICAGARRVPDGSEDIYATSAKAASMAETSARSAYWWPPRV